MDGGGLLRGGGFVTSCDIPGKTQKPPRQLLTSAGSADNPPFRSGEGTERPCKIEATIESHFNRQHWGTLPSPRRGEGDEIP